MKIAEAKRLMQRASGYRVHFEKREGGFLCSDYFPDRDEPPIVELEDAWKLAEQWAAVDPRTYVNVYVIYAHDWVPVENYVERELNRHPPLAVTQEQEP